MTYLLSLVSLVLAALLSVAGASAATPMEEERIASMEALLDSLGPTARERAVFSYAHPDRRRWSRTPGRRAGLAVADMSTGQRLALHRSLRSVLSDRGYLRACMTMSGEEYAAAEEMVLEGETALGPERYWLAVYGEVGVGKWGWRLEGHHLSLRFFFSGERLTSVTPAALGAYPTPHTTGIRAGYATSAFEHTASQRLIDRLRQLPGDPAALRDAPDGLRTERDTFTLHERAGILVALDDTLTRTAVASLLATIIGDYAPDISTAIVAEASAGAIRVGYFAVPDKRSYWFVQSGTLFFERNHYLDTYGPEDNGHVHRVVRDAVSDFGAVR